MNESLKGPLTVFSGLEVATGAASGPVGDFVGATARALKPKLLGDLKEAHRLSEYFNEGDEARLIKIADAQCERVITSIHGLDFQSFEDFSKVANEKELGLWQRIHGFGRRLVEGWHADVSGYDFEADRLNARLVHTLTKRLIHNVPQCGAIMLEKGSTIIEVGERVKSRVLTRTKFIEEIEQYYSGQASAKKPSPAEQTKQSARATFGWNKSRKIDSQPVSEPEPTFAPNTELSKDQVGQLIDEMAREALIADVEVRFLRQIRNIGGLLYGHVQSIVERNQIFDAEKQDFREAWQTGRIILLPEMQLILARKTLTDAGDSNVVEMDYGETIPYTVVRVDVSGASEEVLRLYDFSNVEGLALLPGALIVSNDTPEIRRLLKDTGISALLDLYKNDGADEVW